MIVRDLRNIVDNFKILVAERHSKLLFAQKLGYTFDQVYNSRDLLMDDIIANALVKANSILVGDDKVRIPSWISKETFASFISKLHKTCQS